LIHTVPGDEAKALADFDRTRPPAGSLILVGEARARYLGAPADPIAVTDPVARSS
jgi:hypothetical protein